MRKDKRTQKSIRASCDRLWSLVVRERGYCERCLADGRLEAHHVYGRTDFRLRFEPRNGCVLCHKCHRWAESFPLEFGAWFMRARFGDYCFLVDLHRRGPLRRTTADYLRLEESLKARLDDG